MDSLYYINSVNKKLDFTKPPYIIKDMEEIRDFAMSYERIGNQLEFSDEPAEIPLALNVYADSEKEYDEAVNQLYDIMQYDVISGAEGKLYYNGQYVRCSMVGTSKKDWCKDIPYMLNTIRFVTTKPYWYTEKSTKYFIQPNGNQEFLGYSHGYPYGYFRNVSINHLVNEEFMAADFEMIIFGKCINPFINIGENTYKINVVIEKGEYIYINSETKKIWLVKENGEKENKFSYRFPRTDFFRLIPNGKSVVTWEGDFGFIIKLIHKRREPKNGINLYG